MGAVILASDREVQLVKRTVAQDLEPAELDLFIHMCRQWRLDPLRRQIYAQVYKRKKRVDGQWQETRSVVYVTGIDGYRSIADRTGNYRPGQRSADQRDDARNPTTNPTGIVSATASVWKHAHGEWHEFSETAFWDEFAPLKEEWSDNAKTGRRILDTSGQWGKMGRTMLMKCAEAQALRRGWPDEYGNLYLTEELDQANVIDITPSEQAERANVEAKMSLIGGKDALIVDWCDGKALERISLQAFWDASLRWMHQTNITATEIRVWCHRNTASRAEAKAKAGSHYLDWWKAVEKRVSDLERSETTQAAE